MENEHIKTLDPSSSSYSSNISFTLAPVLFYVLIPVFVLASAPILASSNKLFKQFIKTYLESNQASN